MHSRGPLLEKRVAFLWRKFLICTDNSVWGRRGVEGDAGIRFWFKRDSSGGVRGFAGCFVGCFECVGRPMPGWGSSGILEGRVWF